MVAAAGPAAQQDGSFPIGRTAPSIAHDLHARAVKALAAAHRMSPGDERAEAINQAAVLRNAAAIHRLLGGKRGDPSA